MKRALIVLLLLSTLPLAYGHFELWASATCRCAEDREWKAWLRLGSYASGMLAILCPPAAAVVAWAYPGRRPAGEAPRV